MAQKSVLDVLCLERFPEKRVVLEIDHPERQVVTSIPIGMHLAQFVSAERSS
jgi:hypothetical protein